MKNGVRRKGVSKKKNRRLQEGGIIKIITENKWPSFTHQMVLSLTFRRKISTEKKEQVRNFTGCAFHYLL